MPATKYLDNVGLSHFWGKIKDHISDSIVKEVGYSILEPTSQNLASLDNESIIFYEEDSFNSTPDVLFVSTTGNQSISGAKSFVDGISAASIAVDGNITSTGTISASQFSGNGQNIALATANSIVVTNANKKLTTISTITTTELGYLDGVTSSIQTQLNEKASDINVVHKTENETIEGEKTFSDGISVSGLHYLGERNFTIGTAGTGAGTYLQVNSLVDSKSVTIANQGTNNITFTSKGNITATGTIVGNKIVGDGSSLTALNGSQITSGTINAARIPSLDASKITSGTIDIARLPAGALERLVTVADQTARFALTSNDVQLGDTIKQEDTGLMYYVVNISKLNSADGYVEYTAGTATSVPWSGVTGKPSTFEPSAHNQASSTINAMTGYSKPSSTSAIETSDTLNAAIGKLEKALDGKQASGSYAAASHNQASNTINAMTGYSKPSSTSTIGTSDTLNAAIGKLEKALDGKQASGSYAAASHNHDASNINSGTLDAVRIPNLDASKITSGTIDIARLPAGALERLVTVADQTARFALTSSNVQLGDTVRQSDTGLMYYVVDTSKLNSADGYAEYTAGAATSVPWSGITSKPSTFTPSAHNQASNTINAMTGYSKPSSTSAIGTSDTLNAAIGKLEKALDGKQASGTYLTPSSTLDATKLSGTIPSECYTDTVYTHPTTSGNKHIPSGGSSGQFLGWDSDGTAKWVANPNSNWTTHLYAGAASDSTANATSATTNAATYIVVCDNSNARNAVQVTGTNGTTVSAVNGKITIDSPSLSAIANSKIDALFT